MGKKIIFVAACLIISSICKAELISSWSFDGDILNSVKTSKLKAQEYGRIDFAEGICGKALKLDSDKKSALIVNDSSLFNELNEFSISFWTKLDTKSKNVLADFISKNGEENQGWQLRTYQDYGFASFTIRSSDNSTANCFAGVRVDDGNWHHIAAVYDGRFITLLVDGRFADIKDVPSGGIGKTDSPLVIGAKIARGKTKPYGFLNGLIDELKIFDHAISFQEVQQLADWDTLLRAKLTEIYTDNNVYSAPIHRGAGKHQPENTIESFEYSWKIKFVPEGDIRTTKDDRIVFVHDDDVKRTAPSAPKEFFTKTIGELTLAELKTLDVGEFRGKPGQKIPTIEEVFEVMSKDPSKFIYLDYKTIDMNRLADLVKKYGIEKQVIFTTKNYDLIKIWRKLIPESQTMIWMGDSQEALSRKLNYLRQQEFKDIYIVHIHYKKVGDSYQLSDEFILSVTNELSKKGIIVQIMPWDNDDGKVYERLFELGIKATGTDYPDVLLPI